MTTIKTIEWHGDSVRFLDQTLLPEREEYRTTNDYRRLIDAVKRMEIRGAPLIGIAAGYAAVLASLSVTNTGLAAHKKILGDAIREIGAARPTAVNLQWALGQIGMAISRAESVGELRQSIIAEAVALHEDDAARCLRIGKNGATLIEKPSAGLTHCNAGALATGGIGTALGVIFCAHDAGHISTVFVDETRPLLQGSRLTAWELRRAGVPATLITDNTAAFLMQQKRIDFIMVGADRIAANGDTANKIGTYNLAVLAAYHNIPLYVAAPTSTIDRSLAGGSLIPIEIRGEEEVTRGFGRLTAPEGFPVYAPAFDITPGNLITAIITDEGIVHPPYNFK